MVGCLQPYLNRRLIKCSHVNLEKKRMIDSTCEEFAEFFDALDFSLEHSRKVLMDNFKKEYDEFEEMKLTKFTRWLKEAGRIKNLKVAERKSGSERFISYTVKNCDYTEDKSKVGQMDTLF